MANEKPKNVRGKILIGILILVVIGLGVLLWLNKDKFGSSATTLTPSPGGTVYVPSKDILSDNWVPTPSVMKDMYYTLVDEITPNTTDYLTSKSTGSDDLIFAMKPKTTINSGSNSQITVNVYSKAGYVPGVKSSMAVNIGVNGKWQKAQTTLMGWENPPQWSNKQYKFTGNWTTSDLNSLQVKITAWGGVVSVSISSIYAQVGSSAVSPSPQPSLTFKPETTATRAGLADAIARAYSKSYNKPTPSFKDVPKTHWAYKQIEGLNQAGIMKGYGDGTFKPANNSTRAELTVVVSRAAGIAAYNNPTPSFKDVPKTYWAYKEIEGMKKAGLISGYGDGTYKPDGAGTRATLATMLYRAKKLTNTCTGRMFSDIPSSYWVCKEVEGVYSRGWMPSAIHF